jgi:hypothetical protein
VIEFRASPLSLLSTIGDRSKWLITTYNDFNNGGASVGDSNPRTIAASSDSPSASSTCSVWGLWLECLLIVSTRSHPQMAQQQQCGCRTIHFNVSLHSYRPYLLS